MAKKYREVRRTLRTHGWSVVRVTGSHERWEHADGRRLSVAGGGKDNRDVPSGTLAEIRRTTGLEGTSMMFAVIYELADDGSWHARAADLPVFSCADSREEAEQEIRAGIAFHLEE